MKTLYAIFTALIISTLTLITINMANFSKTKIKPVKQDIEKQAAQDMVRQITVNRKSKKHK